MEQLRRTILAELAGREGSGSPLATWVEQQRSEDFSRLPPLRVYSCADDKPGAFSVPGGYAVRDQGPGSLFTGSAVYNCVRCMLADQGLLPHGLDAAFSPAAPSASTAGRSLSLPVQTYSYWYNQFWTEYNAELVNHNHDSLALVLGATCLPSIARTRSSFLVTLAAYSASRHVVPPKLGIPRLRSTSNDATKRSQAARRRRHSAPPMIQASP